MKITIAGAGEVGTHLARLLSSEDLDITVIDADATRLQALDSTCNLITRTGSPVSFEAQSHAGVNGSTDLFIAVTPSQTENILACQIAKRLGARRTVARIDGYEYMRHECRAFFDNIGVNSLIYPELLAAKEIETALLHPWVRHRFELHDGRLLLVGVKVRSGAPIIGTPLRELTSTHHHIHVAAIKRGHTTIIPRGDDVPLPDDTLYITTTAPSLDEVRRLCGKNETKVRRVMVMGGSRIAIRLAALSRDRWRIKIIDVDIDRCRMLAEKCRDAEIVCADARDIDTLREQGIDDTDAFVALSGSSEANILGCITAKELGVPKVVAEVEDLQFINQAENLGIGSVINKKLLASSRIFQMLLDADSDTSRCLALTDAEVAELVVRPGAKVTREPVMKLKLPRDITLAGMVRDGQGMLIGGQTQLQPGDHVLVFTLGGAIHKLDKLF